MSTDLAVVNAAAGLVRRSRAGDQNATATLLRIGEEARKGGARAVAAFQAAKAYIDQNPAENFQLGIEEPVLIADTTSQGEVPVLPKSKTNAEQRKPVVPRGLFDKLFSPDLTALCIVRACHYKNGMPAAAAVLASGPPLDNAAIRQFGAENFGSEDARSTFFHGVKHPDVETWDAVAPQLEMPLRRCLAIGQCFGRARSIQAVRAGAPVSTISPVAGWELGE